MSYVDLGNNALDHGNAESLSGRLQGEFGTNEAYFLGFNWNWVR